jgi:peptide-methionine (S)-S-oxide reductase
MQQATFATGCFWCTEAVFKELVGVSSVVPGYAGGDTTNPTYAQISTGSTNHAECSQITFDPQQISYQTLLEVFWRVHDPTTLNRQGADVGTQYRSVIFCHDAAQQQMAHASQRKIEAAQVFTAPIVTQIVPLDRFYPAEDYHRDYYARNKLQPYCQVVITPKLAKFRQEFFALLKAAK